MNIVSSVNSGGATQDSGVTISGQGNTELNEVDFLMLLVTELSNQDPLDPMTDRDFIAQMAQINTLNETVKLNENVQALQMLQATSLVGREIEAIGPNGEHVEGTATEVYFLDSEPWVVIDDDVVVNLEYVVRVK